MKNIYVGWVTNTTFLKQRPTFYSKINYSENIGDKMRCVDIYKHINKHYRFIKNEIYEQKRKYDIVVFVKMMNVDCQKEVDRIHAYGGKVIFDANINYYEIWGDYFVEGTKPTGDQQKDSISMTQKSDFVIADSNYIAKIVSRFSGNVEWIPDNVNPVTFYGEKKHQKKETMSLVWSGMEKKAAHLRILKNVFSSLKYNCRLNLNIVSNKRPDVLRELDDLVECHYYKFTEKKYRKVLLDSDVIVSPKILCNGYEMGHTEYKISLGMSLGLPAIASPQQSYVDAISYMGGGIIARTTQEWIDAIRVLVDWKKRENLGRRARMTVIDRYQTSSVAKLYVGLFIKMVLK